MTRKFGYLFNSYYEAVGARHPRPIRGFLTRPDCATVDAYRSHVDSTIETLLTDTDDVTWDSVGGLITLGLHHEQQHQELLLMDILHGFSCNPTEPSYAGPTPLPAQTAPALDWTEFDGGLVEIGHQDGDGVETFHFDNEGPRHSIHLNPFRIANRLVTNGEWLAFIEKRWVRQAGVVAVCDGWAGVQEEKWTAPLYWRLEDDQTWSAFGLRGRQPLNHDAPVCHVSSYEADAFATWSGKRLPTEAEWETAASAVKIDGNFLSQGALRALPTPSGDGIQQMYGDVWEHTRSPYVPYPGFKPDPGAIGEYNGKFMSNQMVLRGGLLCHSARPHTPDLPQFLLSAPTLDVCRCTPCRGSRMTFHQSDTNSASDEVLNPSQQLEFLSDVIEGLSQDQKRISPKYFYDSKGSALFDQNLRA